MKFVSLKNFAKDEPLRATSPLVLMNVNVTVLLPEYWPKTTHPAPSGDNARLKAVCASNQSPPAWGMPAFHRSRVWDFVNMVIV